MRFPVCQKQTNKKSKWELENIYARKGFANNTNLKNDKDNYSEMTFLS